MNLTCQYQSYSNLYSSMNNILQTFKFIEVKTIRSDFAKFIIILFKYDIANMLIKLNYPTQVRRLWAQSKDETGVLLLLHVEVI